MSYYTLRRDASWAKRAIEVDQYATKQAGTASVLEWTILCGGDHYSIMRWVLSLLTSGYFGFSHFPLFSLNDVEQLSLFHCLGLNENEIHHHPENGDIA